MFLEISTAFLALYVPSDTTFVDATLYQALRVFSPALKGCTTSYARFHDGTIAVSQDIHNAVWRLHAAITRGVMINKTSDADVPPWTPNWCAGIPSFFKKLKGSPQDCGQAKIFYSVIVALSGVENRKDLVICVPGCGSQDLGWSYPAAAALLTGRGCSGRFELYDPLTVNATVTVGNFTLCYSSKTVSTVADDVTHVIDDTWPSCMETGAILKAIERKVVVSVKANLCAVSSPFSSLVAMTRSPVRVFSQPYFSGSEQRAVYNYRAPKISRQLRGCYCANCLRSQDHPIVDEVMHHMVGFGVRPCFSFPGRQLMQAAYPIISGRVKDLRSVLPNLDQVTLKRVLQYFSSYDVARSKTAITLDSVQLGRKAKVIQKGEKGRRILMGLLSTDKGGGRREITRSDLPFFFFSDTWCSVLKDFVWIRVEKRGLGWVASSSSVNPPLHGLDLHTLDDTMLKLPGSVDAYDLPNRVTIPVEVPLRSAHFVYQGRNPPARIVVNGHVCVVKSEGKYDTFGQYSLGGHAGPMFYLNLDASVRKGIGGGYYYVVRIISVGKKACPSPLARSTYLLPTGW